VLVQSTNFRMDWFRIRLNLKNAWIWCIEHNHLWYIKDFEIENYADAISYQTPYFEKLSEYLKDKWEDANTFEMRTKCWNILKLDWWVEKIRRNTWNYEGKYRWWTFPVWENFTEAKIFENLNWKFSVFAFPDDNFQVVFCEPFQVEIKKSMLTCTDSKAPEDFIKLLEKISNWEDWEVMVRELWFGMNKWISKNKTLSDINAYERVNWFHISLWKKHQIYRKKISNKVTQRFHIDIFPDVESISFDWKKIFENGEYLI
jgi:hypothetical protein